MTTRAKSLARDLREIERLRRLLEVERQRAEKAWTGYREALYELVELQMKHEAIYQILNERIEE
ncbi:MAG: hypothetical protein DDT26_00193 [Dehalococcoidia bacterium]|nr:hypothetical protein [Chloroflexota bacterium]